MKTKNAKENAKIDRQLDRLEAEFATIKKRADELTAVFKRLSRVCLQSSMYFSSHSASRLNCR